MEENNDTKVLHVPFTVQVMDNTGFEELEKDRLYTVVAVKPDLINEGIYGFKLLEVQPEEPYDSYKNTRFLITVFNPN